MAIELTTGLAIPAKDYGRGVKRFHFCDAAVESVTGGSGAAITAFATVGDAGDWLPFDNQDGQGDITAAPNAGPGGVEWNITGNLNIGGSSQASTTWANTFAKSTNIPCVAEYRDGMYKYFGEVTVTGGAGMTSGINGGADNGIALTFTGSMAVDAPDTVTVASDLATITDA